MRIFDRILREETENNYTGIEDIKYLLIRPEAFMSLKEECIDEFELEGPVSKEDITDNLGLQIVVDENLVEDFKFVLD